MKSDFDKKREISLTSVLSRGCQVVRCRRQQCASCVVTAATVNTTARSAVTAAAASSNEASGKMPSTSVLVGSL